MLSRNASHSLQHLLLITLGRFASLAVQHSMPLRTERNLTDLRLEAVWDFLVEVHQQSGHFINAALKRVNVEGEKHRFRPKHSSWGACVCVCCSSSHLPPKVKLRRMYILKPRALEDFLWRRSWRRRKARGECYALLNAGSVGKDCQCAGGRLHFSSVVGTKDI